MSRLGEISTRYPIRKTEEQKAAFLRYALGAARGAGYTPRIEENGRHRNLVIGDPEHAELIFAAHYDTPACMLLPSPLIPRNLPLFFLYQLMIVLLLFLLSFGAGLLSYWITRQPSLTLIVFLLAYYALLMLLMLGPANRHNVNGGDSGVAAVLELMEALPREHRSRAAFLLFDHGEQARTGSRAYAARHPEIKKRTPVITLDCVGVGEHLLIVGKNYARISPVWQQLPACFKPEAGFTPHFFPSTGTALNTDHQSFRVGIVLSACKRRRMVGYYTPALRTARDTKARQENIDYLTRGLVEVVKSLAEN